MSSEVVPELTLDTLLGSVKNSSSFGDVKQKVSNLQKSNKKHNAPLEEPLAPVKVDRIRRKVQYEETKKEVGKWQNTVKRNRERTTLTFPRPVYDQDDKTDNLVKKFKAENELEKSIDEIVAQSSDVSTNDAKVRSILSYQAIKNQRKKKIKSKKYHRIQRKDKERRELSVEELSMINPDAADAKKQKNEEIRLKERATQRHRGASKFQKGLKKRGVNNEVTRAMLDEQNKVGQQLKQKIESMYSDEEDSDEEDEKKEEEEQKENVVNIKKRILSDEDNPWLKEPKKKKQKTDKPVILKVDVVTQNQDEKIDDEQQKLIQQAFSSEDYEKEFAEEKQNEIDEVNTKKNRKNNEQDLPGWGSWAGKGDLPVPKKRLPTKKQQKPKNPNRKDINLKNVILSEKRDKKFSGYLVKQVPFEYKSKEVFESTTKNAIGKDFNTNQVFNRLITPEVKLKSGLVIKPIGKE